MKSLNIDLQLSLIWGYSISVLETTNLEEIKLKARRSFYAPQNRKNRKAFFELPKDLRDKLHENYNDYITNHKLIDFFIWMKRNEYSLLAIDENRIKTFYLKTGSPVLSIHPPESNLLVKLPGDTSEIIATPYRVQGALDSIIQQNNYTNQFLQTIGSQTTRIENILLNKDTSSSEIVPKNVKIRRILNIKPMATILLGINLGQSGNNENTKLSSHTIELMDEITKRLKSLEISKKDIPEPKDTAILSKPETSDSCYTSESSEQPEINHIEIEKLEKMFLSEQQPQETASVNKTAFRKTRNIVPIKRYYHRPTLVDMQFEEMRDYNAVQFVGNSIVEWNIDGMSEYQIQQILQYMTMYATVSKIKHNNSDQHIAQAIIAGFSGQLKGWWDFYLTDEGKNQVLTAVKNEPSNTVGPDGRIITLRVSYCVNTLIFTITTHFIGASHLQVDINHEQLLNLRCQDLSHFKWYKDVFFAKVFTRPDSGNDIWNEKFLSGLPYLFAERVKNRIKQKNTGVIPYNEYTCGELAAEITAEGVILCNELKLHNQQRKMSNRKVLGDFCEQIGYPPLKVFPKKSKKYFKQDYYP